MSPCCATRVLEKRRRPLRARRGVALIIVLSIIAITLSMSYAILRSQGTILRIQANSDLLARAKQAANTGYLVALHKIHDASWSGADTSFSGTLTAGQTYQVSYTTGDASLVSTSSDYWLYPYRITITITGTAVDSSNSAISVSDHIAAVLQLVPRQLNTEPTNFSTMTQYTAYETTNADFQIEPRRRIEGPVLIQGKVTLFQDSPSDPAANSRYIQDLGLLYTSFNTDGRPFSGKLSMPLNKTPPGTRTTLTSNFGLTLQDTPAASAGSDWTFPAGLTYRLYTGGKAYNFGTASATLQNTSLVANPVTNPAGIFYCSGNMTVRDNVTVQGTLYANGKIQLPGVSLSFQPATLKALRDSSTPIKLPAMVAANDIEFQSTASGNVSGLLASFGQFMVDEGAQSLSLQIAGKVIAKQFTLHDCTEWDLNNGVWSIILTLFNLQKSSGTSNFCVYLGYSGLNSTPATTIKAEAAAPVYHWQTNGNPIFVKHASDSGLRWDVLSWKEYP
ncbi:MAG TPA: hypothetical protein VFE24_14520 [Pirellulales bacterium]|jgi:Tfp pilus assembly protein PilX|nr:hypothetical protein [Pirellulales bacterium]